MSKQFRDHHRAILSTNRPHHGLGISQGSPIGAQEGASVVVPPAARLEQLGGVAEDDNGDVGRGQGAPVG